MEQKVEAGPFPRSAGPVLPFAVTHRSVLAISIPMTFAYLSTPLVGLADTAVIGQLGDAALIGGIAIAAVLFDVLFTTFGFLRGSTTGLTAQAFGAADEEEQVAVLVRAGLVALLCGLLILVLQKPIEWIGMAAMGVEGTIAEAARAYFATRIWAAPFMLANYVILGWVIGRGNGGLGLLLQLLLNGTNIALTIWFVLGLSWGVEGAALGTLIAEALTTIAGLVIIALTLPRLRQPNLARLRERAPIRRMMSVNSDMMIRSFSLLFAFAFFARQGVGLGATLLAANAILMHFFLVGGYFLDGLATAAEQLAGRAVGARYRPAFDRVVRLTTGWALAVAALLSAFLFLAGPWIIDVMTTSPEVREAARRYLPWAALTPLAGAIAFQMDGIFIGATWSRDMRNMMLLSVALYLAAWAALMPAFGNGGLWAALLIFLGARSLTFMMRMRILLPRTFPAGTI